MSKLPLTAFITLLLCLPLGHAQAKPNSGSTQETMTFKSVDISAICSDCSVIQVSGDFGETTMKGFRELLDQGQLKKNTFFVFDSPGGSMQHAMILGVHLREKKIHTIIGRAALRNGEVEIEPGTCASSCVLAFFGGVTRSMPKNSKLGVHSWMPAQLVEPENGKDKAKPKLIDQKTFALHQSYTGLYLKYLETMGIDLRVAVLTLQTPYSGIAWVNPGDRSRWSLVTVDSSLSTPADRRWPVLFLPEHKAPVWPGPLRPNRRSPGSIGDAPVPMGKVDTQDDPELARL